MLSRKKQLRHYQSINKEHGRVEERKVFICQDLAFLEATHQWEKLNTLVMVESRRVKANKITNDYRFYISSLEDKEPKKYLDLSRGHWGVENNLHWQLDLIFEEDNSRIRTANAP